MRFRKIKAHDEDHVSALLPSARDDRVARSSATQTLD
jgi:hypothetical protein